jgi:ribosomal protein S27AE
MSPDIEYYRDEKTGIKYSLVTRREYEPENITECEKTSCCKCGYGTTLHNHRLLCGKRSDFL